MAVMEKADVATSSRTLTSMEVMVIVQALDAYKEQGTIFKSATNEAIEKMKFIKDRLRICAEITVK